MSSYAELPPVDVLLEAYRKRVIEEIEAQLMIGIAPKVKKAAEDAAAAMETVMRQRVDHLMNKTIIEIETKFYGPGEKKDRR